MWGQRVVDGRDFANTAPVFPGNRLRLKNLQQLLAEILIEYRAIRCERLQAVPLNGIMAGGDHQSARCIVVPDEHSTGWGGGDSSVENFAAGGCESSDDGMIQHRSSGPTISRHHNFAAAKDRSQRPSELTGINRVKAVPHNPRSPEILRIRVVTFGFLPGFKMRSSLSAGAHSDENEAYHEPDAMNTESQIPPANLRQR